MKWLLLFGGGLAAFLVASNWKTCSIASYPVIGPNGLPLPVDASGNIIGPNPCGVNGVKCSVGAPVLTTPAFSCLFNPFPGGL